MAPAAILFHGVDVAWYERVLHPVLHEENQHVGDDEGSKVRIRHVAVPEIIGDDHVADQPGNLQQQGRTDEQNTG